MSLTSVVVRAATLVVVLNSLSGCNSPEDGAVTSSQPADSLPAAQTEHSGNPLLANLAEGWNTISPGGDTMCVYGTPYSFFARPADPRKLLISFPGGGACWSGLTCTDEPVGRMDDNPKTVRAEDNPAGSQGIMSEDNPENPFLDYTKILVGYCTGDMHIGDAERPNDGPFEPGQTRISETLHFNGYTNATTVLQWVFDNFESPETVVVSGHTSGSYGTPLYTSLVADHYPDAAVRHLGDGNGALFLGENLQPLPNAWATVELLNRHEGFEGLDSTNFAFEDITIRAAQRHPVIIFTQMITAYDSVLSEMIGYLGYDEPILTAVDAGHAYVKGQVDNYRTYLAGGNKHVISLGYFDSIPQAGNRNRGMPDIYDRFYSYQVDRRRYRDWIADMIEGRPIADVRCSDCSVMNYYSP
ncbi:MAG: pectin acetylesterase-family hydrolase [Candidatus Rariloculaceae bacterium]